MSAPEFLSFSSVVEHEQSKVRLTSDKMIFAVDLVMSITGKDRNNAARVLRRIGEDVFSRSKLVKRQIPGVFGTPSTVLSFPDALELIMVLPGKTAKVIRKQFVDVILGYMANDPQLKEIVPFIDQVLLFFDCSFP